MKIAPLTSNLGAEIWDADVRDPAQFGEIFQTFVAHSVIVLRGQNLTPDAHLDFARKFGPINVNRFFAAHPEHPEIALVTKEPDQTQAIGETWHTDHSYDEMPALGSILHAIETPAVGGDTVFCSMAAAFAALSPAFQSIMMPLKAWHSSRHVFGTDQADTEATQTGRITNAQAARQDALHPVVIRHPLSGRPGLYVNPQFTIGIEGLSTLESDAILGAIYEHCRRPEFQARLRWHPGDVAIWDNRATWHKAINDYPGYRRHMHRITIEGCTLSAHG